MLLCHPGAAAPQSWKTKQPSRVGPGRHPFLVARCSITAATMDAGAVSPGRARRPVSFATAAASILLMAVAVAPASGSSLVGKWTTLAEQDFHFAQNDPPTVPSTRYSHAAVIDAPRRRMIVFLGYFFDHQNTRPTWCRDTWAFGLESRRWTRVHDGSETAPLGRYGHSAVVAGDGSVLVYAGDVGEDHGTGTGRYQSHVSDLWRYDTTTDSWRLLASSTAPGERSLHAAAILAPDGGRSPEVMVVFGGLGMEDTWLYHVARGVWEEWTQEGDTPGQRHGAGVVAHEGLMYLVAGSTVRCRWTCAHLMVCCNARVATGLAGDGSHPPPPPQLRPSVVLKNDVWQFELGRGWKQLAAFKGATQPGPHAQPNARSYHAAAWLGMPGQDILLFAGANCTGRCDLFSDTWVFSVHTQKWAKVPCTGEPSTRYHHTLVQDPATMAMLSFGGESYRPRYMYHNAVIQLEVGGAAQAPAEPSTLLRAVLLLALAAAILAAARLAGWGSTGASRRSKVK